MEVLVEGLVGEGGLVDGKGSVGDGRLGLKFKGQGLVERVEKRVRKEELVETGLEVEFGVRTGKGACW